MDAVSYRNGGDVLDRYAVSILPQIVFRLDARGRVIGVERFCGDEQLPMVQATLGRSVHHCLHPDCSEAACTLLACISAAHQRIAGVRMLEWEQSDAIPGLVLRLSLRSVGLTQESLKHFVRSHPVWMILIGFAHQIFYDFCVLVFVRTICSWQFCAIILEVVQ